MADLSRAIDLDAAFFYPYLLRGQVYYELDLIPQALRDFERTVEAVPDYHYARTPLGTCYYIEGRFAEARRQFLIAYEREQRDLSLPLLVSLCLKREEKEREARKYLTSHLQIFARNSWHYEVASYYTNPTKDFYIIKAANAEKGPAVKYRLLFYVASQYLLQERMMAAVAYLHEVGNITDKFSYRFESPEQKIAAWELKRLEGEE